MKRFTMPLAAAIAATMALVSVASAQQVQPSPTYDDYPGWAQDAFTPEN